MRRSHILRREDRTWGQNFGQGIADWLNKKGLRPRRDRVIRLIRDLQKLEAGSASLNDEQMRLARRALGRLQRYSFFPIVSNMRTGWLVEWIPKGQPRAGSTWEETYVLDVLALLEWGLIARMRECGHCGKWMFARFSHQRFCSSPCQQAHYWKTEAGRESRRRYMRTYRRIKSLPNIK